MNAFLHLKGWSQSPEHSEYEINLITDQKIIAVSNAIVKNERFLQVIDEEKDILFMISHSDDLIFRSNAHSEENYISGKKICFTIAKFSSEIGAMLTIKKHLFPNFYLILRIDNEEYYAGDVSTAEGGENINLISFEDVLKFIAKEISWGNLKGRSWLFKRSLEKKASAEDIIREMKNEISKLKSKLEKIPNWIKKIWKI